MERNGSWDNAVSLGGKGTNASRRVGPTPFRSISERMGEDSGEEDIPRGG